MAHPATAFESHHSARNGFLTAVVQTLDQHARLGEESRLNVGIVCIDLCCPAAVELSLERLGRPLGATAPDVVEERIRILAQGSLSDLVAAAEDARGLLSDELPKRLLPGCTGPVRVALVVAGPRESAAQLLRRAATTTAPVIGTTNARRHGRALRPLRGAELYFDD